MYSSGTCTLRKVDQKYLGSFKYGAGEGRKEERKEGRKEGRMKERKEGRKKERKKGGKDE